jgi:3',5'-cyclic AMP phosphodiesterase CpdA
MTILAHVTDLHLLEPRPWDRDGAARLRLAFLSAGRPIDATARRRRAVEALAFAARHADHVVVTGDLTEEGTDTQLEVLGEVLHEAAVDPDRTTLVPGNHDAYDDASAYHRALGGPLARFAATSTPGAVTALDDVAVVAVSTARRQHYVMAAGALDAQQLARLPRLASRRWLGRRALLLCQHHGPFARRVNAWQWIDGLREHAAVRELLIENPHAFVLHGHEHRVADRAVDPRSPPQSFAAGAGFAGARAVRFYEAAGGRVSPLHLPPPVLCRAA